MNSLSPPLARKSSTFFESGALVRDGDADALVQKRELAESRRERVVLVLELREDRRVGLEPDRGAGLRLRQLAQHLELRGGVAALEIHVVLLPIAPHPHLQLLGQRVHDRDADSVQPARHLVAGLVELAAGVQHGERELDSRDLLDGMDVDGNSASVIDDGDRVVRVNRDFDVRRESRECFVDRVVYDLINQVMETALRCRSDVHPGAFANGFEPLEHLNLTGVVLRRLSRSLRHEHLVHVMKPSPEEKPNRDCASAFFNLLQIRSNSSS